jgi:hypothetical protein
MVAVTVNIWQSNLAYLRVAIILDGNTRDMELKINTLITNCASLYRESIYLSNLLT